MMIRILFASAALLALAGARPAAAETVTWGSCVTNKVGSGIAVDVKFFKTTDIQFSPSQNHSAPGAIQYTTTAGPAYHEPSLLAAKSYCIGDGGTYVAVVSVKGSKLVTVLTDATIAAIAGAGAAAACVGSGLTLCTVAGGAFAAAGTAVIATVPPNYGLFAIYTLAPGRSLDIWGITSDPKAATANTADSVICAKDYVGYACKKNNGDSGVCGLVSNVTPSCQKN